MPTHLIMFDNLVEKLPEVLVDYQRIHDIAHAEVSFFVFCWIRAVAQGRPLSKFVMENCVWKAS